MNTSTVLIILIGGAVVVFGGFFGIVALFQFLLNKSQPKTTPVPEENSQPKPVAQPLAEPPYRAFFGLKQISPLLAIGGICLVVVLVLSGQLSAEPAFRFTGSGEPSSQTSRVLIIVFSLLVQLLFIAVGWIIGASIRNFINRLDMPQTAGLQAQQVIMIAANMIALPQLIAAFITLDIFTYDIFSLHLLPIWAFAVITMVVGGIFIIYRFYNIMRQKNQ
ncbi:MAG: hypothetical protein WC086_01025 [Dehalococcoidales bacterium]